MFRFHPLLSPGVVAVLLLSCSEKKPPRAAEAAVGPEAVAPAPVTPPSGTGLKIATVDMQQLFKEYHGTNEAQKEINVERARI